MSEPARRLIEDAMRLSAEERAAVVDELIARLGDEPLHPDWTNEIERRARRALADPAGGEAWSTVEERLRARLRAR